MFRFSSSSDAYMVTMLTTTSSLFLPKTARFNKIFRFSEGRRWPEGMTTMTYGSVRDVSQAVLIREQGFSRRHQRGSQATRVVWQELYRTRAKPRCAEQFVRAAVWAGDQPLNVFRAFLTSQHYLWEWRWQHYVQPAGPPGARTCGRR